MKIIEKKLNGVFYSHGMFVMMADIQLKEGAEEGFKDWFSESNKVLSGFPGFISRRFLKSNDGSYRIIVEHESKETFIKMHQSPEHEKIHPKGHSFMSADPIRKTFTVAAE
ncbi:MAG: antibiotic biosynthesis monooxygenase [Nitrosopumilus sp.]|nr:antibiotic biosynthesis monooxygenase [Nitrosopumilus sp.]MDH3516976.1 antibiotic biosynthesis monooxygenase [Nitrosopumilus sp.]MDH3565675.1 antibiotic biosynthesis monooxygenase [Nitrosopumilus sp.]MDH5416533.1 antibiotic biosynthesis monooxygenase [Nitrosopumilus sp.]MDH5555540.1 antibiotic biosynthesis monooxygenase [Nitrosopumilus sp.]